MHGGRGTSTETVRAVLADNQNDVVLSVGALLALIVTQLSAGLWWVDAAAALALTSYIAARWAAQGRGQVEQIISGTARVYLGYISAIPRGQVEQIIGRAADPSFLEIVREIQPRCSRDAAEMAAEMKSR